MKFPYLCILLLICFSAWFRRKQFKFKEEIEKRGPDFRSTVFCFGEEEGECWALCRWLRARKFVYDDVITMVEEATEWHSTVMDQIVTLLLSY